MKEPKESQPVSGICASEPHVRAILPTWIVGRRYHAVEIKPGDTVLLCRDLGNAHDAQAIAVMDVKDRQCGHLPRFDAAGIAPLLDAGLVRLSGCAAAPDEDSRIALTLVIEFLPEGAARLFDPVAAPASDAFHRTTLLWLWEHIRDMPSEEAVKLRATLHDDAHEGRMSADNHLLYRLLRGRIAERLAAEQAAEQARAEAEARMREALRFARAARLRPVLDLYTPGQPLTYGNLILIPLRAPPAVAVSFRLLPDVLDQDAVSVQGTESKTAVRIENRFTVPLLVPNETLVSDGLALFRISGTCLVAPQSVVVLPARDVTQSALSVTSEKPKPKAEGVSKNTGPHIHIRMAIRPGHCETRDDALFAPSRQQQPDGADTFPVVANGSQWPSDAPGVAIFSDGLFQSIRVFPDTETARRFVALTVAAEQRDPGPAAAPVLRKARAVEVFTQLWKGVVPEETWGETGALCYDGTLGETVPCESGKFSGEICLYESRLLWMWLY
ncbi:MAG: HIRAN domain-containing protein [bacterium]